MKFTQHQIDMEGSDQIHFSSEFEFYSGNPNESSLLSPQFHLQNQHQSFSDHGFFEISEFDDQEISKISKTQKIPPYLSSLEILSRYGNGFNRLKESSRIEFKKQSITMAETERGFSTEEIMRIAGTKFIQSSYQSVDALSNLSHPLNVPISGLSPEEMNDVELVECLLLSAEKLGFHQYETASKLLNLCDQFSKMTGNPVQRLVYYFSEGLRDKIARETGKMRKFSGEANRVSFTALSGIACLQGMPFFQVGQFTGIQMIIEHISGSKRVHVIDVGLKHGVCWTILMQALASIDKNPIEHLKITAIGTSSREVIETTGERLTNFAKSMNLKFCFKVVMVSDMLDLEKGMFELDENEAIFVYSSYVLNNMIGKANTLESVMKVIREINPRLMVVNEMEASHNSPIFVNRFIEALFFCSAYFDCLEDCMKRDDEHRLETESRYFRQGIRNIVAFEGDERLVRHVKIDVWRAFFTRIGMVGIELSMACLYQAKLVVEKFDCGSSCSLDMDGNCLIIGWKGTPIQSFSVWKFL